ARRPAWCSWCGSPPCSSPSPSSPSWPRASTASGCAPSTTDARGPATRSCGSGLKALYFGTYDRTSPRNTQVVSCLRRAGVTVVERHREVWGRHNWSVGVRQLARMALAEGALARRREDDADVVLVGYPGHFDMPAARRAARGRPLVFNQLVSLHDTLAADRARFRPRAAAAGVLRGIDHVAFRSADLVVADSAAHAAYFRQAFDLPAERVAVVLVGPHEARL